MKATFFVLAVVLAAAHAGSSFSESDGVLCHTMSSGNTMWETGLGSSSCVQDPNAPAFFYKGTCDNKQGTYQIQGYSNAECSSLDASAPLTLNATAVDAGVNVVVWNSNNHYFVACNKCPPSEQE